ncbi:MULTISPECIES: hypothetical protein [unclassified Ruminococcus]|uniref:hypothetical protein n=1 Tax=unclassified Ruminococcus TaxID=2608920 RepID=UPI00210EC48C|nr:MULTISPECIES: hypothetical protein [unclassified Ruminococcus]
MKLSRDTAPKAVKAACFIKSVFIGETKNTPAAKRVLCPFGDRWYLSSWQEKVNLHLKTDFSRKEREQPNSTKIFLLAYKLLKIGRNYAIILYQHLFSDFIATRC